MVPFIDLKAQYHSIKPEIDTAITQVLENSQFILGPEVVGFETEFADYCQTRFAIGVNSGTSALHLALLAAGIGPGDEVITIPFTFVATVAAIVYTGAKPVFVDIDPVTFCMDVTRIEKAITSSTRAILPVHLYGQPADMDPIMAIAARYNLVVIEDAAQAHGAEYKGKRVGSIGHMGCFSFYPGKNLGAYGEGGAITTNDSGYNRTIRMLRDWGAEKKYHHELKGYNYRMEGIQGAILRVKLQYLDVWTASRNACAEHYAELLSSSGVDLPQKAAYTLRHVYHVYAIRCQQRDSLQRYLNDKGIQTGIHYPIPVHLQQSYADMGYHQGDFPQAEAAANEVISLPMFAELTTDNQAIIAIAVRDFRKERV